MTYELLIITYELLIMNYELWIILLISLVIIIITNKLYYIILYYIILYYIILYYIILYYKIKLNDYFAITSLGGRGFEPLYIKCKFTAKPTQLTPLF